LADELVIKITGDVNGYKASLGEANSETDKFSVSLESVAKTSAIAFAASTAAIGLSIHAYGEAEDASKRLILTLRNQGIYTDSLAASYKRFADEVEKKTGIDGDQVTAAQSVAQAYLGHTKITQELTNAIADLAVAEGITLNDAAEKIGRTVGTSTNAFARQGLVLADNISTSDRYAKVLDYVNAKAGGQAETANTGVGSFKALKTAIENLNEEVGQKFVPLFEAANVSLTKLVNSAKDTPAVGTFTAGVLASVAAVSQVAGTASAAAIGFNALSTTLASFGVVLTATRTAVYLLAGATGIGLLVTVLGTVAAYALDAGKGIDFFKKHIPEAKDEIKKLTAEMESLGPKGKSFWKDLLSPYGQEVQIDKIKAKIADLQKVVDEADKKTAEEDAKKSNIAKREQDERDRLRNAQVEKERAHLEVLKAVQGQAAQDRIDSLQKEADLRGQMADTQNKKELAILQDLYARQKEVTKRTELENIERHKEFENLRAQADEELAAQKMANTKLLRDEEIAELQASVQTKNDIDRQLAKEELATQIKSHNLFLAEQKKYGTAYATINTAMHSAVFEGTKSAFAEMAALQQSSNATLKAIGKAAAVANIIISTAEAAMKVYAGFSAIPIVGQALGAAAAASVIAYGGERVAQVTAAAEGGLITGGVPGKDSVPVLAQRNEIISPAQNFEEVIGSVRAAREARKFSPDVADTATSNKEMVAKLDEISQKLQQPSTTNITIQGDHIGEPSFIDSLVTKISDAIEFRNAKLYGVNV
jgi:hypothetical protein